MTDDDNPLAALARIQAEAALRRLAADIKRETGTHLLGGVDALFQPIVPPAGVGDMRPVFAVTHGAAVASIRTAGLWLTSMADHVEQAPWADGLFNDCDRIFAEMLTKAGDDLVRFRATRDCGGEG